MPRASARKQPARTQSTPYQTSSPELESHSVGPRDSRSGETINEADLVTSSRVSTRPKRQTRNQSQANVSNHEAAPGILHTRKKLKCPFPTCTSDPSKLRFYDPNAAAFIENWRREKRESKKQESKKRLVDGRGEASTSDADLMQTMYLAPRAPRVTSSGNTRKISRPSPAAAPSTTDNSASPLPPLTYRVEQVGDFHFSQYLGEPSLNAESFELSPASSSHTQSRDNGSSSQTPVASSSRLIPTHVPSYSSLAQPIKQEYQSGVYVRSSYHHKTFVGTTNSTFSSVPNQNASRPGAIPTRTKQSPISKTLRNRDTAQQASSSTRPAPYRVPPPRAYVSAQVPSQFHHSEGQPAAHHASGVERSLPSRHFYPVTQHRPPHYPSQYPQGAHLPNGATVPSDNSSTPSPYLYLGTNMAIPSNAFYPPSTSRALPPPPSVPAVGTSNAHQFFPDTLPNNNGFVTSQPFPEIQQYHGFHPLPYDAASQWSASTPSHFDPYGSSVATPESWTGASEPAVANQGLNEMALFPNISESIDPLDTFGYSFDSMFKPEPQF
ncbi:hypothetical protein SISSUDRAFT_1129769 [Sistotremastrum suecicum HHB10207 ss-3]|uniref:Uncharacterized protein n=1 Tax=Sistotremastrum suecicum HHB10207 ss-3 TaxID=1314776 RepID=A0A166CBS0_9AGAM|nr:hypothetical protein SISSUDRAFT_1129769 [Sistotremastrum suecicum HHB10207 ss-3]